MEQIVKPTFKRAVQDFLDCFELVFDADWDHTTRSLRADCPSSTIATNGSFIFPKVEDEDNNWGNRGALLAAYRKLKIVAQAENRFAGLVGQWEIEEDGYDDGEGNIIEKGELVFSGTYDYPYDVPSDCNCCEDCNQWTAGVSCKEDGLGYCSCQCCRDEHNAHMAKIRKINIVQLIKKFPGRTTKELTGKLDVYETFITTRIKKAGSALRRTGTGKSGNPYRHYIANAPIVTTVAKKEAA